MEQSLFEQMGGTYRQEGDYLLPNLTLPPQEQHPIGVWGKRRWEYLRKHREPIYTALFLQGKLDSHLADVEEQAQEMFDRLTAQMAKQQGVTETLKATDMMAWVGRMNNIRNAVEEIVLYELIYC